MFYLLLLYNAQRVQIFTSYFVHLGNLSEDTNSIFSVSSTNIWPIEGMGARMYLQGRQGSVDTSVTETIELAEIGYLYYFIVKDRIL